MILPSRWDPLFRDIERLFEDLWPSLKWPTSVSGFSTNVYETDKSVVVEAELPGVKKEDIKISYSDGYLRIEAKREETKEEKKKKYYRKEVRYGEYARIIPIPEYVDVEKAKASLKDGVLTIEFPKTEEGPKGVEIKVE